jgi:hypothetical protein
MESCLSRLPSSSSISSPVSSPHLARIEPFVPGSNYGWSYTSDTSETGAAGWSIGDTSYASFPTGDWTALRIGGDVPMLFSVDADAAQAPLPATALLLLPGIAALSDARRRRGAFGNFLAGRRAPAIARRDGGDAVSAAPAGYASR